MSEHKPRGHPLIGDPEQRSDPQADPVGRDLLPETGRRGSVDPKSGEADGSGSGPGGGREGEDFGEETSGGS